MSCFKKITSRVKGFTLVEVIVTIVAVGILGTIFINFMGTALTSSWNAVEITRDEANAEKLLEQIVGEYVVLITATIRLMRSTASPPLMAARRLTVSASQPNISPLIRAAASKPGALTT